MTKIEALRQTIINLEQNRVEYNWEHSDSCNCGVLARTLCNGSSIHDAGYDPNLLRDPKDRGIFARAAYCITSDLPLPLVFQSLKDAGFTHPELLELEYLGNENICKRAKIRLRAHWKGFRIADNTKFSNKETLIEYLKAWVKILEEQQVEVRVETPIETIKLKEKIVYVSVPTTILEYTEFINN